MSRLYDLQQYLGWSDGRVLRRLADEFDENQQYYQQFDNIDDRIFAAYQKIVRQKLIGEKLL